VTRFRIALSDQKESETMAKRTIAVMGSTGAQGGGLVRALLRQRDAQVRAITRKPTGDAARALADAGCQLVAADLDDAASLTRAFEGADAAFCVTNFWEHFSPDKELTQAKNLADAARATKLKHVVWSTLEDTRERVPLEDERMPTLQGRYKVPHFDAKGEANRFFADLPTTFLYTSFFWDNLIYFGMGPKREADGTVGFVLPMESAKLPGIAAEDIGKCAAGIFAHGGDWVGKSVGIAGEHLTGAEMAQALTQSLGEKVVHRAVSPATYRSFGFPGADDLGNMFQYKQEFEREFRAARDVSISRALNPELKSFADFLAANKGRIAIG
jgi:uncharacterized protein YbjT (DUF2867 family)